MVRKLSLLGGAVIAAALIASVGATSSRAASTPPATTFAPVPSLTPVATQKLWRKLVQRAGARRLSTAACSPLRAVFYAPTDWRRLTTKLAATASPCAEYYISVPPLAADKAQLRADEAWRIRALGPAFHALAEINVTGWTSWVAAVPGRTWYEAGVVARQRMAGAGYDVGAGDTWALNELSSAVRQGTGNARANMRAFLNGLYDGDGSTPVQGVVFIAGIGQGTADLSLYQARLQDWYEDAPFWTDMSRFVSDWSQELYGDVRNYAVAGLSREGRRDALNEYLQHQASLASVAPASAAAARSFLGGTYNPLANAAWQYDAAFGWTNVPVDLMQDYVSAQVYAVRAAGNSRFGFPWSPKNPGMPAGDFTAQTDALLVRLAAAIADSAQTPEAACGTPWCDGALDGAALNGSWGTFAAWKPSRLAFTTPAQTLVPGAPSEPISAELQTATGGAYAAGLSVPVTLASSSPTGEFSVDAAGPWATTLATSIASGATTTSFYFRDSTSGSVTITATAAGKTAGTQTATVTALPVPPPPQPVPEPPPSVPSPPGSGSGPPPDVPVEANVSANPPTDTQPSNDVASVTITAAAPAVPARARDAALALRVVGSAPVKVTRRGAVATVSVQFSVSEAARLEARLTPLRSRKPLTLLPRTSLAGMRSAKLLPVATAAVRRAGRYAFAARVPAAKLVRGRTYVLHVSAVDSAGRKRALTIRVRA